MPWYWKGNDHGIYEMTYSPTNRKVRLSDEQLKEIMLLDAASNEKGAAAIEGVGKRGMKRDVETNRIHPAYLIRGEKMAPDPNNPRKFVIVFDF